jgi:hypothetical protein
LVQNARDRRCRAHAFLIETGADASRKRGSAKAEIERVA